MNWKIAGIVLVIIAASVAGLMIARSRAHPPVNVTLRFAVTPVEKLDFAVRQAKTARFKYLMSRKSGVKPFLAQKLSVEAVPKTSLMAAQLSVQTKDEGQRYADAFVETLQGVCGGQVQLVLSARSIR